MTTCMTMVIRILSKMVDKKRKGYHRNTKKWKKDTMVIHFIFYKPSKNQENKFINQ